MFDTKAKDKTIANLEEQVAFLRAQVTSLGERNDRLMEALAQRSGIDLVLPIAPRPAEPAPEPLVPAAKADAWWKANTQLGHTIATPPKEEKVSAPKS